jgi:uncharacterized protein (TIGR02118 family)
VIKVSVMYPSTAGSRFDMAYYLNTHIPLVERLLGPALKGAAVDQGIGGEQAGSAPPYLAMGHLLFDSLEAFQTAFGPHAQAIVADIPNYTNCEAVLQISEVKR